MLERIKKLFYMQSGGAYLNHLRKIGCQIGQGTKIFAHPLNVYIDPSRPCLIQIGKNVVITRNVTILTHGFDWSVLNGVHGDILGSSGKVEIGDNVFIGMNATILKETTIGDNVIIGANCFIRGGEWPSDCVIAGNPARVVCSLEEYYEKRKAAQLSEAKELAKEYRKVNGCAPPPELFWEFFWLFTDRQEKITNQAFLDIMAVNGNHEKTYKRYQETSPIYKNYEEFLEDCLGEKPD